MGKKEPKETKGTVQIGKKPASKKKKLIITVVCVGVIGVAAIGFSMSNKSEAATETVYKETTATKGNLTVGITESGNTVLGTQTVDYDIEATTSSTSSSSSSSASQAGGMGTAGSSSSSSSSSSSGTTMPSLEVEELYVAASDSVAEGDAILKVTDASYTAVKTYLEQAVESAKLTLKQAEIDRTLAKTTAENTYKSNSSQAELAQEAYDNTIKKLANAVTNAKKELTEAKESISSYTKAINNDTYYTDYKIATLKKTVTSKQKTVDTLTSKIEKLEAAGVTATTSPAGDASSEQTSTSDDASKLASYKTQLSAAEQELSAAEQAYEQAYEKYETALTQAKSELAKLQSQLSSLQLSYDEAVTNQKKGKLEAQATLDEALVTANNASTLYDIDLDGIDDDVTSATESLKSAEEQLANFNALVVDGKIVANCTGMVTELGYAVGDSISSSTSIATIADASEVTITVSVDQEDIASIAVNDEVNVDFTAYTGMTYKGVVSSISTTASSDSSSTVTYPVVVTLTGDVSAIYSGMSADVTFVTKEMEDVLYVSNKTIINEGTKSYVKVKASDGTITKVEVETGFSDGNNVEITSGITEGETVLIESQVKSN